MTDDSPNPTDDPPDSTDDPPDPADDRSEESAETPDDVADEEDSPSDRTEEFDVRDESREADRERTDESTDRSSDGHSGSSEDDPDDRPDQTGPHDRSGESENQNGDQNGNENGNDGSPNPPAPSRDEQPPSTPSSRRPESGFEATPGGQLLSRLFRLLESGANGRFGGYENFEDASRPDESARSERVFDTEVDLTFSAIDPSGSGTSRGRPAESFGERVSGPSRRDAAASIDVAKRRYGTELEIVADVSSISEDRVRVGVDGDELVIADGDRELTRIDLPWPETNADASVNNGILTVRVTRVDDPDPVRGEIDG